MSKTRPGSASDHLPVGPHNFRVKNCNNALPSGGLQYGGYLVGNIIHDGVGEESVPLAGPLLLEDILLTPGELVHIRLCRV